MSYQRHITLYMTLKRAGNWRNDNNVSLVSATTSPPTRRPPGSVVVKIKLRMPDAAFDPAAIPSLVADIPLESILPAQNDIEIIVEDPA